MSSGQGPGFLEDARRTRRGDAPTSLAWNAVNLSGEVMLIERPIANSANSGHSMRPSTTMKPRTVSVKNESKRKTKRSSDNEDNASRRDSAYDKDELDQDADDHKADDGYEMGAFGENTLIPYSLAL
jgi:hypothetical protein